jgi:hypothetical protein
VRHLSPLAGEALKRLQPDIDLIFKEWGLQKLGQSQYNDDALINKKAWIMLINSHMKKKPRLGTSIHLITNPIPLGLDLSLALAL